MPRQEGTLEQQRNESYTFVLLLFSSLVERKDTALCPHRTLSPTGGRHRLIMISLTDKYVKQADDLIWLLYQMCFVENWTD